MKKFIYLFIFVLLTTHKATALEVAVTNSNSSASSTLQAIKNELEALRSEIDSKLSNLETNLTNDINNKISALDQKITNTTNTLENKINQQAGVTTTLRQARSSTTLFPSTTAYCQPGEKVVGGGGSCSDGWAYVFNSNPNGNGWYFSCVPRQRINTYVTAYAICAK